MKLSRLISKLKSFHTIFIAPSKSWQLPKKSEVLIYDACGAEAMMPYLTNYSVAIMHVRGEFINAPCFFLAMLRLSFWKGKPLNAYTEAFIHAVSPLLALTFIDNNTAFYEISNRFPDIRTVFIQNGTRSEVGDIFYSLVKSDSYYVDYMLVHGNVIGRHYLNYVSGQFIPIGSLKNNAISRSIQATDDTILFISQWLTKPVDGKALYVEQDGKTVDWETFFEAENKVLDFLDKWCAKNNKHLKICGRGKEDDGPEKFFYADRLNKCEWQYMPRIDNYSSYKLIDAAEIVVFIDSTLGYESISRGKKTAGFSCRMVSTHEQFYVFGWPASLPNNGPFWTNDQEEMQFERVMDYLNAVSDADWEQTRQNCTGELIEFDAGNTRFANLLDQLLNRTRSQRHVN